jgi:3-phenylpropionate/trans-cinnamate dioxygenase ferredoxin reductase component
VAGASLAGLRAAETLRRDGFTGEVIVIGAEAHRPYDRPPLSKQVLAGVWAVDEIDLVGSATDLDVSWRLGCAIERLDPAGRAVWLESGERVAFNGLVIATGCRPRTLSAAAGLGGVHVLRTVDDCLALKAELDARPGRLVVVGAGFIGSEVAATARGMGLAVTLVEALPVPLSRALGEAMGGVMAEVHRDHGVDVRLNVGVEGFEAGSDDRVGRVRLSDGMAVDADVVVVGVGVRPNTEWLEGSGLRLDDGVVCDETCLAAPGVVAAGDVARWFNPVFGEVMRVEHWENAQTQGEHAARRLLAEVEGGANGRVGPVEPYAPVPWFWSDQYDRKIQLAGRSSADDTVAVVDGSIEDRQFVALYGRAGRLVGALGMNRPRPIMEWRRLILDGISWDEALAR